MREKEKLQDGALNHVAIVMDGNRRWATDRNLGYIDGYNAGADNAIAIIKHAIARGIKHLSLFAFSSENWNRPSGEVTDILSVLEHYLGSNYLKQIQELGVKMIFIGNNSRVQAHLQNKIANICSTSEQNKNITVYIAFSYGGREEITHALKSIVHKATKDQGFLQKNEINEKLISEHMYEPSMPNIDLFIRPGREKRLSNFFLWHLHYSEIYFSDVLWPDFNPEQFDIAIQDFYNRKRHFGV